MQSPAIKAFPPAFLEVLTPGMRFLPLAPLQPPLALAMRLFLRKHPRVFERLSFSPNPLIVIDPEDLPLQFLLCCDPKAPSLKAIRPQRHSALPMQENHEESAAAVIRGPLAELIDLFQGRSDGDSLFFSRRMVVEGDMETVVALRNALDSEEIDIVGEICSLLGPLEGPAEKLAQRVEGILTRGVKSEKTGEDER
jgi:predicted lipid carrier protein YhbT